MSGYESYDEDEALNAKEMSSWAGDTIGRRDGKDIVAESYKERNQLFDDQIAIGELTDYEIQIEHNVYGGFLILLMIDKSQYHAWLEQERTVRSERGNYDDLDEWEEKCVPPDETCWRDLTCKIAQGMLCFISMYIQFLFVFFMLQHISKDEYTEKTESPLLDGTTENIFTTWNSNNILTREAVCGGKEVVFQEDLADSLSKYASLATLFGQPLSRGLMFGILSIAVWAAVVVENIRKAIDFLILAVFPCKSRSMILSAHDNVILIVIVVIALFRIAVQILIAYHGIFFLAYTDNLPDFILNSVALEFVYQIPYKMYNAFSSTRTISWVTVASESNGSQKIFTRELPAWIKIFNGAIFMFVGGGVILGLGIKAIIPFDHVLTVEVFGELCKGTEKLATGGFIKEVEALR